MISRFALTWSAADICLMAQAPDGDYVRYADHVAMVCAMRDRLLAVAKACPGCDGTGLVSVFEQIDPDDITKGCREAVQECDDCADIREALT